MKKFFVKVIDAVKGMRFLKGGAQLFLWFVIASCIVGALVFWYHYPNVKLGFFGL